VYWVRSRLLPTCVAFILSRDSSHDCKEMVVEISSIVLCHREGSLLKLSEEQRMWQFSNCHELNNNVLINCANSARDDEVCSSSNSGCFEVHFHFVQFDQSLVDLEC
jgi:hypothetical protein